MTRTDYREALNTVRDELQSLRELRSQTDARIAQLERTAAGLAALCGEHDTEPIKGLTDACRSVLQTAQEREDFTPTKMRDVLEERGYDLEKYSNPLSVIHTTLKRLAEKGEVVIVAKGGNQIGYRWTLNDQTALAALKTKKGKSTVLEFVEELTRKRA